MYYKIFLKAIFATILGVILLNSPMACSNRLTILGLKNIEEHIATHVVPPTHKLSVSFNPTLPSGIKALFTINVPDSFNFDPTLPSDTEALCPINVPAPFNFDPTLPSDTEALLTINGTHLTIEYYDISALEKIDDYLIKNCRNFLENLEEVDMSFCGFKGLCDFPEMVYFLENVKRLNLTGNGLTFIPSFLSSMKKLEEVDLSANKITSSDVTFFDQIAENPIERADDSSMSENPIERALFGPQSCLSSVFKVKRLNLSGNKLDCIPPEVQSMPNLTHLHLFGNKIKDLPNWQKSPQNLKFLDLRDNPVEKPIALPHWANNMPNLEILF